MIYKDPPYPITESANPFAKENIKQYLDSNGRNNAVATISTLPIKFCLLTVKGRVSSEWRRTALFYTTYSGSVYVIGSNGGRPDAPQWCKNIIEYPIVWIQHDFDEYWAVCKEVDRDTDLETYKAVWDKMNSIYPMYNKFQEKSIDRIIPVIEIKRI